jgi:thioesterase domain-containing protein
MARQLRGAGQDVALLALIDGNSPAMAGEISTEDAYLLAVILMEWLRDTTSRSGRSIRLELEPLAPAQQLARALQILQESHIDLATADPGWLGQQVQLFRCRLQAAQKYQPGIYDQRITVFLSSQVTAPVQIAAAVPPADDLGWQHYARLPIDVHLLPGYHEALMQEPSVQVLAAHIQACLDGSQLNHGARQC